MSGSDLRSMDTQTTIAQDKAPPPLRAASASEMGLPKWQLSRVLAEGYFCLTNTHSDDSWPSLDYVAAAHDKEGLLEFALEIFVWSAVGIAQVYLKEVLQKLADRQISLNPYEVIPAVEAVTKAWQAVLSCTALQEKTQTLETSPGRQHGEKKSSLQEILGKPIFAKSLQQKSGGRLSLLRSPSTC